MVEEAGIERFIRSDLITFSSYAASTFPMNWKGIL